MDDRRDHPAEPEQTTHGWEEGQERAPDTPEDLREPRYSRGQEVEGDPEEDAKPRYSRGQEERSGDPEEDTEGRFSTGQDHGPPAHDR